MSILPPYYQTKRAENYIAIFILLLGLAWRANYMRQSHPYVDEYFTIVAAEMVQQKGLPWLPSGLFYSHGFLYTYITALLGGLVKAAGDSAAILATEMIYRVPNLLISAASLSVLFSVTKQWFGARAALVALALMAVYPHGVVWGGRVRMYTLVFLLVPLLAYAFYRAAVRPDDKKWYILTLLLLFLGLMVHHWVMILVPVLIGGVIIVGWGCKSPAIRSWQWWLPGLIVMGLASILSSRLASLWIARPETTAQDIGWSGLLEATLGQLGLLSQGRANIVAFWREFVWENPYNLTVFILTILSLMALLWLFRAYRRHSSEGRYFWPMVYLYFLFWGLFLGFLFLLEPELKQPRYAAPILILAFIIIGGWWKIGWSKLSGFLPKNPSVRNLTAYLTVFILLAGFGRLAAWQIPRIFGEGLPALAYEQAFQFVRTNLEPGEVVLSPLPAAAYLYLDDPGYFIAQDATYTFVHLNQQGIPGDRWVGAPWLHTAGDLKEILGDSPRTWLVIDTFSLDSQFHSDWRQVMRYNTTPVWHEDGVTIFLAEGLTRDVPTEPDIPVNFQLGNEVKLIGYTWALSPSELRLYLFWQVLARFPADYTTFVHIRNQAGETIAQVDTQPLSGEYPTSRWRVGETVVDEITLPLPSDLPAGIYRLLVGLYRWDTLERLRVMDDTSGENAVELRTFEVR